MKAKEVDQEGKSGRVKNEKWAKRPRKAKAEEPNVNGSKCRDEKD